MADNPNPSRVTDQLWNLWEGFEAIEPIVVLGGIYAPKSGYHDTRDANPPTNYSVAQYPIDRQGPGDKAAAIDLTFPDAQAKPPRYGTINKYSQRLLAAGQAGRDADPRTVYMREFYGNIDTDSEVEGWDYARHGAATSDTSHLWHIHISIHRGYVTDPEMTRAVLSILKGETVAQWRGEDSDMQEVRVWLGTDGHPWEVTGPMQFKRQLSEAKYTDGPNQGKFIAVVELQYYAGYPEAGAPHYQVVDLSTGSPTDPRNIPGVDITNLGTGSGGLAPHTHDLTLGGAVGSVKPA